MVFKNLGLLMLLFIFHSVLPMEAGFTPNKELVAAVKSYSKGKVERIIAQMPTFTEAEYIYYNRILVNEGRVFGIHPNGSVPERWFLPTVAATPSLAILAVILGLSSAGMKKVIKGLTKPTVNATKTDIFNFYALKSIYYSLLTLTGVSILGTIGLPAHFVFHAYYCDQQSKISNLLSNKAIPS